MIRQLHECPYIKSSEFPRNSEENSRIKIRAFRENLGILRTRKMFKNPRKARTFAGPRIPRKLGKLGQFHLMKSSDNFPRISKKLGKLGMCIKILEFEKFHFTGNLEEHMFVIRRSFAQLLNFFRREINDSGSRRDDGFAVSSCFWDGLTVFGSKNDGFTVPLFLNGFQNSSQNLIRSVKLSQN